MALLKYVFAIDRKNYKRWMSISVHGLQTLSTLHPDIYREYNDNGSFMVQKSERVFSAIPKDQAHEQNNKIFRGGSNPDYARDRPNFACRASWARMGKNGQKSFFPERSFLNSLKCVWLPFNYITSYLGCSFMS